MHAQDALPWLLLLIFISSLVLLISSAKYTEWAAPQMLDTKQWIRLVLYSGTMPLASLVYSSIHIAILHFEAILPSAFVIAFAAFQAVGWMVVSGIWTHCETSSSPLPSLCPQGSMADGGRSLSVGLTVFKDALSWSLAAQFFLTVFLNVKAKRHRKRAGCKDEDGFFELYEYESRV